MISIKCGAASLGKLGRAAERGILDALEQALKRGDRAETRALAGRLKSGFAQIYVMFGDFGAG